MDAFVILFKAFATAVARAFFPAAFAETRQMFTDTAEDAKSQRELRKRLGDRILTKWRTGVMAGLLLVTAVVGSGCGTRAVFIPDGEPVRLREPLMKVPVWVMGADGIPVKSVINVPEGWFIVADPGVDEKPEAAAPVAPPAANPTGQFYIPEVQGNPAVRY